MDIWKVVCNGCQAVLEEGAGSWQVEAPRPQAPCLTCGSLDRGLIAGWEENPSERQRQMIAAVPRTVPDTAEEEEEELSFHFLLQYDGGSFNERVWREEGERLPGADDIRYREARADKLAHIAKARLERELGEAAPGSRWRAPLTGPDGGRGPGGDVVELITPIFHAAAAIADFVAVYWVLSEGRKRLKRLAGGREPLANEGSAIVFAAQPVFELTGSTDLTFAFSTPMLGRHPGKWAPDEGFTVGFRGEDAMWVVALNVYGDVLGVTELPVPGSLPARWDM